MKNKGFSLIELLVAIAILTIGLFGTLSLLITNIRYNEGNQMRIAAQKLLEDYALEFRSMPYSTFYKNKLKDSLGFSESIKPGYPSNADILSDCPAGFEDKLYKNDNITKNFNGYNQKYKYTIKLCIDENYLSPYLKRAYLWIYWKYRGKFHKLKTEIFVGHKPKEGK